MSFGSGFTSSLRQFGGLPTIPVGHFSGTSRLQLGGVPIMPFGHLGGSGRLQFGHLPVVPSGHFFGSSTLRQLGHLPVVPSGHFLGSSTLRQLGHLPVVPSGHCLGSSTLRQLGHLPVVPSGHCLGSFDLAAVGPLAGRTLRALLARRLGTAPAVPDLADGAAMALVEPLTIRAAGQRHQSRPARAAVAGPPEAGRADLRGRLDAVAHPGRQIIGRVVLVISGLDVLRRSHRADNARPVVELAVQRPRNIVVARHAAR